MKLKTVSDLKQLLLSNQWSPEELAEHVPVSNMTIRRLMDKPGAAALPKKYILIFEQAFGTLTSTDDLSEQWVQQGLGPDSKQISEKLVKYAQSLEENDIEPQISEKIKTSKITSTKLVYSLKQLLSLLRSSPPRLKLLVLGALAYFIDPIDLIPDVLGGIGFVDDLGVALYVLKQLKKGTKTHVS